jgi:hypothetical protein
MHAQTATIENGFVHLPQTAPWLAEYLHELALFPHGGHDYQVDSTAQSSTGSRCPAARTASTPSTACATKNCAANKACRRRDRRTCQTDSADWRSPRWRADKGLGYAWQKSNKEGWWPRRALRGQAGPLPEPRKPSSMPPFMVAAVPIPDRPGSLEICFFCVRHPSICVNPASAEHRAKCSTVATSRPAVGPGASSRSPASACRRRFGDRASNSRIAPTPPSPAASDRSSETGC